jgi:general secretion pathway protein I
VAKPGFTLLEVLVALIIFALAFGILAQIFQTGLRQSTTAEVATEATLFAQSQLARVGVELPLQVGEVAGENEDGLRWQTAIREAEPPTEEGVASYLVEVTVAWGPGPADQVTLTTLRIGYLPQ